MIHDLFLACLKARAEYECMATQDAIEALADEFGSRAHMFEVFTWPMFTDAHLCDLVMVAWAKAPLKLATGRSRDEWIAIFNRPSCGAHNV